MEKIHWNSENREALKAKNPFSCEKINFNSLQKKLFFN